MTPPTDSRRSWLWIGLGACALLLLCGACALGLGLLAYYAYTIENPVALPSATAEGPTPMSGEIDVPIEGYDHAPEGSDITYDHYPPSSGTHYPAPLPWGVYTEPVPEGYFVHNLEHSGIVILYHCAEACPDLEQQLSDLYDHAPTDPNFGEVKILITPYEKELPATLVALAWGHQLNLDEFDEDVLLLWYERFYDQGPELVP